MKKCTICGLEKEDNEFRFQHNQCKKCEYQKYKLNHIKWVSKNKEKLQEYKKEYNSKFYLDNPDYNKNYYEKHKEEIKDSSKEWRENNQDKVIKYRKENSYKYQKEKHKVRKERLANDEVYYLKEEIRNCIRNSFNRRKYTKQQHTEEIVGCNIDYLIEHLKKTYKERYKEDWHKGINVHIDHIIPLATANTKEEVIKLCHYTNLQLLKAQDNLIKGSKT